MSTQPPTQAESSSSPPAEGGATSRAGFLRIAAAAGFVLAAGGVALVCGSDDDEDGDGASGRGGRPTPQQADAAILNYALSLEYLEARLYERAAGSGLFRGDELALLRAFGEHERDHIRALEDALEEMGFAAARPPKLKLDVRDRVTVLKAAQRLENLGAAAYLGQADRISSRKILATALSIHAVEARHAAALNTILGKDITPTGSFARGASIQDVTGVLELFSA
jgi:hypothetical protein